MQNMWFNRPIREKLGKNVEQMWYGRHFVPATMGRFQPLAMP
jgi:hypothetical protein